MKHSSENIGDLFKNKLDNFSAEGSHDEWLKMDIALDKVNFFKFSLSTFNIYYSALILLCFCFSTASIANELFFSSPERPAALGNTHREESSLTEKNLKETSATAPSVKNKNNPGQTPTVHPENTVAKKTTTAKGPASETEKANSEQTTEKNDIVSVDHETTSNVSIAPTESAKPQEAKQPTVTTADKKPAPAKKTVYITRQDTIILYDTLKTSKKKG